jgi:hypothetical protein
MRVAALVLLLAGASSAAADEVILKNGGRVSGVVVARTDAAITLEVGPGRLTLPIARVERVVAGGSALGRYRQRAAQLAANDVAGWLELAGWARDSDLLTQAREALEHVLALDPQNAAAHRARGDVLLGERWMSLEDSYRAKGLVLFEGSWVTPEERAALERSRAEEQAATRARAEAEARVREAEARARAAEAEAERAAAAAAAAAVPQGPVWLPIGGIGSPFGGPGCCPPRHVSVPPRCTSTPPPVVVTPPVPPRLPRQHTNH